MFPLRQPSIQTSWSISNCCVGYLLCRFADRTPPKNLLSTSYVLFLVFHLDWLCSQGSSNSRALLACGRFATSVSLLINYWTVRKCNAFWSEFIVLPAATCQVGSAGWTRLTWNPRPWMSMVFGTKIISNRDFKRNPGQSQGPLAIVLPLFLLRGALMNARGLSIGNTFQNGVLETTNLQSLQSNTFPALRTAFERASNWTTVWHASCVASHFLQVLLAERSSWIWCTRNLGVTYHETSFAKEPDFMSPRKCVADGILFNPCPCLPGREVLR